MSSSFRRRRGPATTMTAVLTALALTVTACGGDDGGGSSATGGAKQHKLSLIVGLKGDEFFLTMNCAAQAEAKKLGATLAYQGGDEWSPDKQTPIVNAAAASKPDGVLIGPTDSKAMYPPIKQLADNGAKIALVDTTLERADLAVTQISSNNEQGGVQAAKTLGELIGGKGKVFVVNVKPGITTTDARGVGFEKQAKAMGLDYVGQDYSQDQSDKAASITKAILAKHPDLKGIFAANTISAEGVASALKEAGKSGQVKIIAFDATPKEIEDLKAGVVQALIAQKPGEMGAQAVQQTIAAIDGKPTKKTIETGFVSMTKDNLAETEKYAYKGGC
jgi:ribose transport system substrate-binding protein